MDDGFRCVFSALVAHPDDCSIEYRHLARNARARDSWNMESQYWVRKSVEEYLAYHSVVQFGSNFTVMASTSEPDGVALELIIRGLFLDEDQMAGFEDVIRTYVSYQN